MGDFIKELNIIDFLGLLLLGCALLLILGGEPKMQIFRQEYACLKYKYSYGDFLALYAD